MYKGWNDLLLKVVALTMAFSSPSTRKTCRTALGEHNSNSYFVMKPNIQCFRKGPQLRTWSSWGPNCWNGPHLVLILNKALNITYLRLQHDAVARECVPTFRLADDVQGHRPGPSLKPQGVLCVTDGQDKHLQHVYGYLSFKKNETLTSRRLSWSWSWKKRSRHSWSLSDGLPAGTTM